MHHAIVGKDRCRATVIVVESLKLDGACRCRGWWLGRRGSRRGTTTTGEER